MQKSILAIHMLICAVILPERENPCSEILTAIIDQVVKENPRAILSFNYNISHSLMESLEKAEIIEQQVLDSLKEQDGNITSLPCQDYYSAQMAGINQESRQQGKRRSQLRFATPVIIYNTAHLFFENLFISETGRVSGGAAFYQLMKKDGADWLVIDKKILEWY